MSSENRLRPPARGSAKIKTKSRKSGRLRLANLYDPNHYDPKTQDGNLTRPPAAQRSKDTEASGNAGDRSGAKSDCGPGEGSGCKYNKNTLLSLRNRETFQETFQESERNLKMANPIEYFSNHTPRTNKRNIKSRYKQQAYMNFTYISNDMIVSNLTPAVGSRQEASRMSRGQMTCQLPCGHRVPKARSGKEQDVVTQKEVS